MEVLIIVYAMKPEAKSEMEKETCEDNELISLIEVIQNGWPTKHRLPDNLKKYCHYHEELTIFDNVLLKQDRIYRLARNLKSYNVCTPDILI